MLSELTDAQREAVTHFEGPLLILAGPGSGKTRVITHRVAWLISQGVPGQNILALTFTNKAAEEMGRRIEQLTGDPTVWVGTFHRFCARLLRKYAPFVGLQENYTIYDAEDNVRALRRVLGQLELDNSRFTPQTIAKRISRAKNNLISPDEFAAKSGEALDEIVRVVYPAYQRELSSSNAADFDDLLYHLAAVLRENPELRAALDRRYRFVLVDEYQDTNSAQYAIARALSVDHPNLAVTGDPDQSIYSWRGANLNNILEFERDFPNVRVVRLERNYRSTQRILRVAAGLIAHNLRRKEKALFTENGVGSPVRLITYATQKEEAEGIAARIAAEIHAGRRRPGDFAVFYRINALSRALEFAFRDLGIPYQMVHGLEFFQRKEIKDVLAYLHLLNNPRDGVALLRVINTPPRGIGKTTIDRLSRFAQRRGLSLLEAAREVIKPRPAVAPHDDTNAGGFASDFGARAKSPLTRFVKLYDRLAAAADAPLEEVVGLVLSETGYQKRLSESELEEDQQRLANVEELLTVARDFDERHPCGGRLEEFLEETSLVNDTDAWEVDSDRVTLMTLHASKGLEFPVVFLIAAEEGLLPHERCRRWEEQLEEERRLMFVGITRAQRELQISMARYRDFRGARKLTVPSSFLMELPRDEMEMGFAGEEERVVTFDTEPKSPVESRSATDAGGFIPGDGVRLTTGAALANRGAPPTPTAPDDFRQGMLVVHPVHGLGRISALSGNGAGRRATIDFRPPAGRKKFLLREASLQPVGRTSRE